MHEGWIVFNDHFFHNHELILTTGSILSQISLRFIPDQLMEIGERGILQLLSPV